MKAAFITEPGPVENLVFGELPNPEPGAGQVLVRVRAASVNRVDVFTREGSHGTRARPQHVPGLDLAGDVVGRGIDATRFEVGGRVMGTGAGGTYAELAVAAESNLVSIPEGLSYEEAAAAPTAFCAGWHCLVCKAGLQVGETVLVLAGGSGVGSAAVQIAKSASARVITTVGSDAKVEKAKAIGADEVIVRTREDVAARVQELTGGEGVDLVYDHVGQATWESSIASLKVGGRYVDERGDVRAPGADPPGAAVAQRSVGAGDDDARLGGPGDGHRSDRARCVEAGDRPSAAVRGGEPGPRGTGVG